MQLDGVRWSYRSVRGSLGAAVMLLFIDGALTGTYLLSLLACPLWFVISLARSAIGRPGWGLSLVRIAIPAMTLGLVWANNAVQLAIAETNARRVVAACEEFRAAHGSLPEKLDDLVPRHLTAVPVAKYCLMWNRFLYFPRSPMLYWHVVPPYLRKIYNFETRQWRYLD